MGKKAQLFLKILLFLPQLSGEIWEKRLQNPSDPPPKNPIFPDFPDFFEKKGPGPSKNPQKPRILVKNPPSNPHLLSLNKGGFSKTPLIMPK